MSKKDTANNITRSHWEKSGLSYKDIGSKEFFRLVEILKPILQNNNFTYLKMDITTIPKKFAPIFDMNEKGTMKRAFIRCKSYYFKEREAISFNEDGFVGFCGWADTNNTKPFVLAFYIWIRELRKTFKNR